MTIHREKSSTVHAKIAHRNRPLKGSTASIGCSRHPSLIRASSREMPANIQHTAADGRRTSFASGCKRETRVSTSDLPNRFSRDQSFTSTSIQKVPPKYWDPEGRRKNFASRYKRENRVRVGGPKIYEKYITTECHIRQKNEDSAQVDTRKKLFAEELTDKSMAIFHRSTQRQFVFAFGWGRAAASRAALLFIRSHTYASASNVGSAMRTRVAWT